MIRYADLPIFPISDLSRFPKPVFPSEVVRQTLEYHQRRRARFFGFHKHMENDRVRNLGNGCEKRLHEHVATTVLPLGVVTILVIFTGGLCAG